MKYDGYFCVLLTTVCLNLGYAQGPPPTPGDNQTSGLKIVVSEGEGARNSIKAHTGAPVLVEVQDAQGRPVPGAQVIFQLPASGASGSFPGGALMQRTVTNARGQAATSGFAPNEAEGRMNIKVTASLAGASASAVVSQTNVLRTGMEKGGKKKWWVILAAGAAGGVIAGVAGGGSHGTSAPTAPPSSIVLVPGSVTVGGPR